MTCLNLGLSTGYKNTVLGALPLIMEFSGSPRARAPVIMSHMRRAAFREILSLYMCAVRGEFLTIEGHFKTGLMGFFVE